MDPERSKRILITCQNFAPGVSATDDNIHDLLEGLLDKGWDVAVCCWTSSVGKPADGPADGGYGRMRVFKLESSRLDRALWTMAVRYVVMLAKHLAKDGSGYDLILTTDEPLGIRLLLSACRRPFRMGADHIAWLMDFAPARRQKGGSSVGKRFLRRVADRATIAGLRASDRIVVIGRCMAKRLVGLGIGEERISMIGIWPNLAAPELDASPRTADGDEPFCFLYSGHCGPWHDYATLAAVLPALRGSRIRFCFAGGGVGIDAIRTRVARERLTNVRFEERVERAEVPRLLSSADAHLVTLNASAAGSCVPSKLYAAMAVARPVIFVGPPDSQAAEDVIAAEAGAVVAPGDSRGLEAAIRQFADDPETSRRLGLNGQRWFLKNRTREIAVEAWSRLLKGTFA
jgi:glycosyltransferase involved in cell wall biosynthesis